MGLDQYLNRMPRYKNTTVREVNAIEQYFSWLEARKQKSKFANCTFKEWCGIDDAELPAKDVIEFYKPFYTCKYYAWDTNHEYGHNRIKEEVGYWRKANQIHKWFVDHVQDGEDDCDYHHECTKEVLEELLATCEKVLAGTVMTYGKVVNGYTFKNGKQVPCYEDGKVIVNPEFCHDLLPLTDGFFFGNQQYNEWYLEDIADTVKILNEVLATTDFETQMVFYRSSW